MPTFGKRANERPAGGGREVWVKNFKEKVTKIRFMWGDPNTWIDVREHYDKGLGAKGMFYPCAKHEGMESCWGCDYLVEHPEWSDLEVAGQANGKDKLTRDERKKLDPGWAVRDTSSKFIFPALDEKDYLNLYKIGWNFYKDLKALHELIKDSGQDLSTVDYAVLRTGESFNDTSYQAQAISAPYERKPKVPLYTPEQISMTLLKAYKEAGEAYGYDVADLDDVLANSEAAQPAASSATVPDPAPVTDEAQSHMLPPAEHVEPAKPGDVVSETLAAAKNNKADLGLPGPTPDAALKPREMEGPDLKAWLDSHEVEYSSKAPRTVLIGLVEKKLTELAAAAPASGNPPF